MPPRTVTYYEVETTGGRSLLLPGSRVFSHLSGKNYLRKSIADVNPGEKVIFLNEHIDRELKEVEPFLGQSPRYKAAEEALFRRNSHGEKIPVFRVELIRGLNGLVEGINYSPENLEARIMREGADFSQEEYWRMRSYVQNGLAEIAAEEADVPERKQKAITEWLTGETVAPSDWNIFYALALITGNKAFGDIFAPPQQRPTSPTFQDHYRLYNVVRSGIMNWLARKKSGPSAEGINYEAPSGEEQAGMKPAAVAKENGKIHLTLEMRIVMGEFFEEVTPDWSIARVLSITRHDMPKSAMEGMEEGKKARLHKGIYAKPEHPKGIALSDLYTLSQENEVLIDLLGALAFRYVSIPTAFTEAIEFGKTYVTLPGMDVKKPMEQWQPLAVPTANFKSMLAMVCLGKTVNNYPIQRIREGLRTKPKPFLHWLDLLTGYFYPGMTSGRVDEELGLPEGTAYRLYEAQTNLARSMPPMFYEAAQMLAEREGQWKTLGRPARREKELKLQDLNRRLRLRYGFDGETSKTLISQHLTKGLNRWFHEIIVNCEVILDSEEMLRGLVTPYKNNYLTRNEVEDILAKYGLQVLMQFIHPNNFTFDSVKQMPATFLR